MSYLRVYCISEQVTEAEKEVQRALTAVNNIFLSNQRFLAGKCSGVGFKSVPIVNMLLYLLLGNEPTLADLIGYSEIITLQVVSFDFSSFPNIQKWFVAMQGLPHHNEVQSAIIAASSPKAKL